MRRRGASCGGTRLCPERSRLEAIRGCVDAGRSHPRVRPARDPAPVRPGWFTWVTAPRLRWIVPVTAAATVAVVFFATRPLIAPGDGVPAADVQVQMARAEPTELAPPGEEQNETTSAPLDRGGSAGKGAAWRHEDEQQLAPRRRIRCRPPAAGGVRRFPTASAGCLERATALTWPRCADSGTRRPRSQAAPADGRETIRAGTHGSETRPVAARKPVPAPAGA